MKKVLVPQTKLETVAEALAALTPEERAALLATISPPPPAFNPRETNIGPVGPAPTAAPAVVAKLPSAVKIHWTTLYPHIAARDPRTGQPRARRTRTGGQFSCRRLALVNLFDPNPATSKRYIVVPVHLDPRSWPIPNYERVMDPGVYPEDKEPGNIEVVFDFADEMETFMAAWGLPNAARYDPLRNNDSGSAFEMATGRLPTMFADARNAHPIPHAQGTPMPPRSENPFAFNPASPPQGPEHQQGQPQPPPGGWPNQR